VVYSNECKYKVFTTAALIQIFIMHHRLVVLAEAVLLVVQLVAAFTVVVVAANRVIKFFGAVSLEELTVLL